MVKNIGNFAIQNETKGVQGSGSNWKSVFHAVKSVGRESFFINQMVFCNVLP